MMADWHLNWKAPAQGLFLWLLSRDQKYFLTRSAHPILLAGESLQLPGIALKLFELVPVFCKSQLVEFNAILQLFDLLIEFHMQQQGICIEYQHPYSEPDRYHQVAIPRAKEPFDPFDIHMCEFRKVKGTSRPSHPANYEHGSRGFSPSYIRWNEFS